MAEGGENFDKTLEKASNALERARKALKEADNAKKGLDLKGKDFPSLISGKLEYSGKCFMPCPSTGP